MNHNPIQVKKKLKPCCFKNIDKAVQIGRAQYACVKCSNDVSLMWYFYQIAIDESNESK